VTTLHLRRLVWVFAALAVLFAQTGARGDTGDGGAPPPDAATAGADEAAAGGDAGAPTPASGALATPPEFAPAATSATLTTTPLIDAPTPAQAEAPRPITRRLWFWMAITGVVVGAVLIGIAVKNPSVTRPACPSDYTCPL
jgi:hypothetical protein